jgi:hypothetical protein
LVIFMSYWVGFLGADEGSQYFERKMVMLSAIHQENHKFELPVATFPLML